MKKSHIFLLIYVLTLISCSSGKTIQKNENTNKFSNYLFDRFNDKTLKTNLFLDSLRSIEGRSIESMNDCLNPSRKEMLADLYNKNLLNSDTLIFIENGGDCILPSGFQYNTFVYTSCNKEIRFYHYKSVYNKENVYVNEIFVNEKVEKNEAIKAIIDNKFPDYLRIQKIEQKNNCASKYKYSMFTKLEQRYKFWHKEVTLGEHECIQ